MKHLKTTIAILSVIFITSQNVFPVNPIKAGFEKEKETIQMCDFTFEQISYVIELREVHNYYPVQIPEYDANNVITWYSLSKKYDTDLCTLLLLNDVAKPNELKAGQIVLIPNNK
ncbi:LysM peptidoglycan-binding domain-containing protein [Flammeovirga sp. OC4]|uniref:LysM peptidoglycan-binding domain-containing protein n=1 Tax=Flammeovirga sp. OC4 TaxID=1382345 RepID=UPI0012E08F3A|nr:LysM peptidoglycan-binding domain-containing protein [Flammeovirga sp. OC4]